MKPGTTTTLRSTTFQRTSEDNGGIPAVAQALVVNCAATSVVNTLNIEPAELLTGEIRKIMGGLVALYAAAAFCVTTYKV